MSSTSRRSLTPTKQNSDYIIAESQPKTTNNKIEIVISDDTDLNNNIETTSQVVESLESNNNTSSSSHQTRATSPIFITSPSHRSSRPASRSPLSSSHLVEHAEQVAADSQLEHFLDSLNLDTTESHFREELIDQLLARNDLANDLETTLSDSETIINENQASVEEHKKESEPLKLYKLRGASDAESSSSSTKNPSWVRPPSHFDEEAVRELTNEQLESTLEYFILSGYRVSQMTKTYDDIEAVTKLLDEKERDLELAATIGKQLLERDQELEAKIEFLEIQLEKTTDMVNQLRYDISLKDNLLKTFLDSEYEDEQQQGMLADRKRVNSVNVELLNDYKRRLESLEYENEVLRSQAENFEKESRHKESKEADLIAGCINEYHNTQSQLRSAQDELRYKTAECQSQQDEIRDLFTQIFELQLRIKTLNRESSEMHVIHEQSKQELLQQITELKEKYGECMVLLTQTQEELGQLRKKSSSASSLLVNSASTAIHRQRSSTTNSNYNYSIDQVGVDLGELPGTITTSNGGGGGDLLFMVDETEPEEDDDETSAYDLESSFYLNKPIILNNSKSSLYSPWMLTTATNTNCTHVSNSINNTSSIQNEDQSLAAELFSTMAREYRSHNQSSNSHRKLSKSSDFVRKVRQQLKKNLPGGSSNTDSMQSDSEVEGALGGGASSRGSRQSTRKLSVCFPASQQNKSSTLVNSTSSVAGAAAAGTTIFGPRFPACPTPDSCLSTGSASIYSSSQSHHSHLIARSHSAAAGMYTLPEKLQIVKPIEGSQTLQHWQQLATPNLGCLFETRPGIAIKGSDDNHQHAHYYFDDDEIVVNNKKEFLSSLNHQSNEDFDDGIYEDDADYFDDEEEFLNEFYDPNDKQPLNIQNDSGGGGGGGGGNMRVLTPTKVQLLSKLLSNEENKADQELEQTEPSNNPVTIIDFFKNISTRYFSNNNPTKRISPPSSSIKRRQSLLAKAARKECDDPDTPPSSPINLPPLSTADEESTRFQLFDVIESAKNTCKGFLKLAPTPPATPNNELEDDPSSSSSSSSSSDDDESQQQQQHSSSVLNNMHSFFDQIAAKLNVFSSFTTIKQQSSVVVTSSSSFTKPVIYSEPPREIKIQQFEEEEDPEVTSITNNNKNRDDDNDEHTKNSLLNVNKVEFTLCSTPPPSPSRFSPSKFSPPLPDLLVESESGGDASTASSASAYTQEEMRKSAFVRVTSLNPYLNKSLDLNHLLDSLSTLRRGRQQQQTTAESCFYGGGLVSSYHCSGGDPRR